MRGTIGTVTQSLLSSGFNSVRSQKDHFCNRKGLPICLPTYVPILHVFQPIVVLRLPVYIATSGNQSYYFSETKFRELSEEYHKHVAFILSELSFLNLHVAAEFYRKTIFKNCSTFQNFEHNNLKI